MHCSTLNPGHRTHGQGPRHVEGFDGRLLCCKRSSFSSLHRNGDSANKMNQKRSSHLTGVAHRCICTYVRGPSSLPAYARASGWRHGPLPGSRTAGSRASDCDPVLEAQQAALSVRSASSLSILATHSDHGGEQQQPGLVVAVIQTVVHSVRERSLFRGSPTGHDPGWRDLFPSWYGTASSGNHSDTLDSPLGWRPHGPPRCRFGLGPSTDHLRSSRRSARTEGSRGNQLVQPPPHT
jgi:hypothetical protein